jgi:hypothetical protein
MPRTVVDSGVLDHRTDVAFVTRRPAHWLPVTNPQFLYCRMFVIKKVSRCISDTQRPTTAHPDEIHARRRPADAIVKRTSVESRAEHDRIHEAHRGDRLVAGK